MSDDFGSYGFTKQEALEEIEQLETENERLRAALERIAGGDGYYPELARSLLRAALSPHQTSGAAE